MPLGKFEKRWPTIFSNLLYVSLYMYQNVISSAGKSFSVVIWPSTEQKKIWTRFALQLFSEWLKHSLPFMLIFAEIKHFNQAEVAQNAEQRS